MKDLQDPIRKSGCYRLSIEDIGKWKDILESIYYNDPTTAENNDVDWSDVVDEKLYIQFTNHARNFKLTMTLYYTNGTFIVQGSSAALDIWKEEYYMNMCKQYNHVMPAPVDVSEIPVPVDAQINNTQSTPLKCK